MTALLPEENLKAFIDDTVITVFDTMLGRSLTPSVSGTIFPSKEEQIIGMVGLAGAVTAVVCLRVPEAASHPITRAMTGASADDELSEADVNDVVGELANIIAGKLKSCFRRNGAAISLSLPTIVRGHHIDLESISGTERHSFTFHDRTESTVVEFYSLKLSQDPL